MSWKSYNQSLVRYPKHGFSLDLSLMDIDPALVAELQPKIAKAFTEMDALEDGKIANPDEDRMVGHYWLRDAGLAPTEEIRRQITDPLDDLKGFAEKVHTGAVCPPNGGSFNNSC